ncbi:hypothetical protein ONE63_008441 [Megalurothrips usitatus]|uniref:Gustatory receptor n=1 Tax=Megalurothrips usitatus TaxID=439358 RepID=A0AAV7XL63_9NEOP|nr:hypothetical protein ONE63_008441 [Megalurothrips usitatus]
MKPLVTVAFYIGLCPIGNPPDYKPARRTIAWGIVSSAGWIVGVGVILVAEFISVYRIERQLRWEAWERFNNSNITTATATTLYLGMSSKVLKILTVSSGSAMFLAFFGLFVGHFRKAEHLPRVFQQGDALPGKPRWRDILFVVELSVFTMPVSGHLLKAYYESHGVSHVDAFSLLAVLYSVEKFMLLHLVGRVGTAFDAINRQLEAVGEEVTAGKGDPEAFCDAVRSLRQSHMDTCELLETVTRAYEVQVLSFLVAEFVFMVLVLYVQFRKMYTSTMRWMDSIGIVFMFIITQLSTLIFCTCKDTSEKGNKTAILVHKLLNSGRFRGEQVQQLIYFSMQTVHRKVSMTPYDAVTMDYSLLRAMMGSVAMHIVILAQFNISGSRPSS